jgi:hypothetical protein
VQFSIRPIRPLVCRREAVGIGIAPPEEKQVMFVKRIRAAWLAAGVLAALSASARADGDGCCAAPCAPAMRTVCVTEWVPQNVVENRTVYKQVCEVEKYTAYRTECVAEQRVRTYCVSRMVPEWREEVRVCWVPVTTIEKRECLKPVVTCKPVTTVCRKCVDMGHYECREVPCHESCFAKWRRKHHSDCCEECPPTKIEKVWVPCKVWVETPVTTMVKTCTMVPTVVEVSVCKMVEKRETVKVCSYRCVTEEKKENVTVMVPRCVAYQATRNVVRCVPTEEKVTVCRMVSRTVEKQVPVETCCYSNCCESGRHHKRCH